MSDRRATTITIEVYASDNEVRLYEAMMELLSLPIWDNNERVNRSRVIAQVADRYADGQ